MSHLERLFHFVHDWRPEGSLEIRRTVLPRSGFKRARMTLVATFLVVSLIGTYIELRWSVGAARLLLSVLLLIGAAAVGIVVVLVGRRPPTVVIDPDRAVVKIGVDSVRFHELGPIRTFARRDDVESARHTLVHEMNPPLRDPVRHEVYVRHGSRRVMLGESSTRSEADEFAARLDEKLGRHTA